MFRQQSSNPALNAFGVDRWDDLAGVETRAKTMTIAGTTMKTATLLAICSITAIVFWMQAVTPALLNNNLGSMFPWLIGSVIGGIVLGLVCCFVPKSSPFVGPVYAAVEGVALATISAFVMQRFLGKMDPSLIFQAVTLTFAIFGGMLIGFAGGVIKAGGILQKMFIACSIGVGLYFVVILVGNVFLGAGIPNLWASASPIGIGFSVLLVLMASYSLVLDFDLIQRGVRTGAPKYMEWYAGVGLLISLVWLYIEILRLLAKMRSND
jgi:uncharacterized YccA/Bax inhibitor family protein